jgi:hypothetical protein
MKTTVIYHSADFDGLFCREIARKFLPNAELIGWNFGDKPIQMEMEGFYYILDLSPDCLGSEVWDSSRIIWIDHHKSSMEKWPATISGWRIDGVAACRLAWQWFSGGKVPGMRGGLPEKQHFIDRLVEEPLAVRLAGEYDIWDKRDPDAELFQHGLRSIPLTDGIWDELLEPKNLPNLVGDILENGISLQFARTNENESIIKEIGFDLDFEGLKFLACNHARYNSHLFTAGLRPDHDACFGFKWTGKEWSISLYHAPGKEHHDLSLIAKKYGGGGHRGACGFRIKDNPALGMKQPD